MCVRPSCVQRPYLMMCKMMKLSRNTQELMENGNNSVGRIFLFFLVTSSYFLCEARVTTSINLFKNSNLRSIICTTRSQQSVCYTKLLSTHNTIVSMRTQSKGMWSTCHNKCMILIHLHEFIAESKLVHKEKLIESTAYHLFEVAAFAVDK